MRAENPLYRPVFVGREGELRQLQAAFDGALSGQGVLVTVIGEPGIGKTALCEQLATYVAMRGGRTLVGHCYEEGSLSLPYLAFVEALRSYVLARPPEALRAELGNGASEVARIVSEVRERVQVEPRAAIGDPEEERWRLLQAVTGFLRNASGVQPLVLVLEDLHWADRGTLDLLIHLARNLAGARLLVVGTYRDVEVDRAHPLSAALAELRRASNFGRVLLRGLTAEEVQRMMNGITGQEVRWAFAEAVHRQTEGNPLFVQEVLRYLLEEGHITHEAGRWHRVGETPPEMHIPEGLRDVIGKRLSQLSSQCNRVLAVAAVTGRDFELETLRRVAELPEEALIEALEEARRVAVLEERARVGVIRYRFAHAFFRQTLYEEMSAPRRLRLHQQVARALESQHASRLEEHAAELAEHFAQSTDAEDLKKAVHYGELAARRAVAVYAYGEAVRLLEQAIEVQQVLDPLDTAKRCDLLLLLGETLIPAGEPQRATEEAAPQALELAEALHDGRRASRACQFALEGMVRYGGARLERSAVFREWAQRADRYAASGTVERVYADHALANHKALTGEEREAWDLHSRALALARQLDDSEALFRSAWKIVQWSAAPQHLEEMVAVADEISARPREGVNPRTLGSFLWYAGLVYLQSGQRARLEELGRQVAELAERTRDPGLQWRPMVLDVILATLDGNLEGSLEAAAHLIARSEDLGMALLGRLQADGWTIRARLNLGRFDDARHAAANFVEEPSFAVCISAHAGRQDEAQQALHGLLVERHIGSDEDETSAHRLVPLLEAAVIIGDRDAAALLLTRLGPYSARVTYIGSFTCIGRHLGAAAVLLEDREAARRYYARALEVAGRVRYRPEIALTRLQLAELLLAEDDLTARAEALAHLDFAIEEFRAMKMQPYLERALGHKGLLKA